MSKYFQRRLDCNTKWAITRNNWVCLKKTHNRSSLNIKCEGESTYADFSVNITTAAIICRHSRWRRQKCVDVSILNQREVSYYFNKITFMISETLQFTMTHFPSISLGNYGSSSNYAEKKGGVTLCKMRWRTTAVPALCMRTGRKTLTGVILGHQKRLNRRVVHSCFF